MQPTFTPHDVRPVADDVPLDLSRPRPSPPDLAQLVNVPVGRVATTAERPMPVFDLQETQPSRPKKKSALNEGLVQYSLPVTDDDRDIDAYFRAQESNIRDAVEEAVRRDMSTRVSVHIDILFYRTAVSGEITRMDGYFIINSFAISDAEDFDLARIIATVNARIDNFNQRGSNWQVERIIRCHLNFVPYRPTQGLSYFETPKVIGDKKCTINVQNSDNKCFLYAILAQTHAVAHNQHRERVGHYLPHLNTLNTDGIEFPMKIRQIPKFEAQNEHVSVNVLYYDCDDKYIAPLYVSKHRDRQHHVNLLLIENEQGDTHYILVTKLSALVRGRSKHHGKNSFAPTVCTACRTIMCSRNT
jgi:hypothetical protein